MYLLGAKRGFVLLPRRWVVERSFAWATRFRRLVKDYERYASTLADLHLVAFAWRDAPAAIRNAISTGELRPDEAGEVTADAARARLARRLNAI